MDLIPTRANAERIAARARASRRAAAGPPLSAPGVFFIGAAFIVAGAALALAMALYGLFVPWIAAPILLGLAPAAILWRRGSAAAVAILFLVPLVALPVAIETVAWPIGRIGDLGADSAPPANLFTAGFVASGWRIDEARLARSDIIARRRKAGVRTIAPLLPAGAAADAAVAVWVVGYAYAGHVRDWLSPGHWNEPGGFLRLAGGDLDAALQETRVAARAQGLRIVDAPLLVVHAADPAAARDAEARELALIVGAGLALWALIAAFDAWRARRRRPLTTRSARVG